MRHFFSACSCCFVVFMAVVILSSCSTTRKISGDPISKILSDTLFRNAHTGFYLYDPVDKKVLHNYQGEKYFVPASNTKILSCYAGMKYLGRDLKAFDWIDLDTAILIVPTGDPSFLHPDFPNHPGAAFIRNSVKPIYITDLHWKSHAWGSGWSWDDYSAAYMAERSPMPIYGNVIRWQQGISRKENPSFPGDTLDIFFSSEPEVSFPVDFTAPSPTGDFDVNRQQDRNAFIITSGKEKDARVNVPFRTYGLQTMLTLISDTLHRELHVMDTAIAGQLIRQRRKETVYSQPVDSILRPMMHRSDNFFAEQTLLMAGYEMQGTLQEQQAAENLLKTDLKGMPQSPRWADGSGLSRYNLFTPMDFVFVLEKIQREFGMERIKTVFPTSGNGTLRSFLPDMPGKMYAKTGTLTGVIALSGFIQGKSGKWLIFSFLVNNHRQPTSEIRKKMEALLRQAAAEN